MPIRILCPNCKYKINAPEKAYGRKAKCPSCGGILIIQAPQPTAASPLPKLDGKSDDVARRRAFGTSASEEPASDQFVATDEKVIEKRGRDKGARRTPLMIVSGGIVLLLVITSILWMTGVFSVSQNRHAARLGDPEVPKGKAPEVQPAKQEEKSREGESANNPPPAKANPSPPPKASQPQTPDAQKAPEPVTPATPPPVELFDCFELSKTLAMAKKDEFFLFDLNKRGIRSRFSTRNAKITLRNQAGEIIDYKMYLSFAKYDFDSQVYSVESIVNMTMTYKGAKQLTLDYYLKLAIPGKPDEARRWSEFYKQRKLKLDVVFRIKGFSTIEEEDSTGRSLLDNVVEAQAVQAVLAADD